LLAETIEIRLPTLWRYEMGNVLGLKKPGMAMSEGLARAHAEVDGFLSA
jgi:hypothetical protein